MKNVLIFKYFSKKRDKIIMKLNKTHLLSQVRSLDHPFESFALRKITGILCLLILFI